MYVTLTLNMAENFNVAIVRFIMNCARKDKAL
jgi:hypothetical protein